MANEELTNQNLPYSVVLNSQQYPNENNQGGQEANLEEYFENHLENFSNNLVQIKEIFKQAMQVDINYEFKLSIKNTLINMKDLISQITQYFTMFEEEFRVKMLDKKRKAGLTKEGEGNFLNDDLLGNGNNDDSGFKAEEYNEKLDEIHMELDELNFVNIDRLSEIRDLNNKLEILNEHLNSLMKDIEDKRKKLLETEANITDENALIRSYETNLHEKNKLLKDKLIEYNQLKKKSDMLNKEIGDMFFDIIEVDKRIEAMRQPLTETEERKDNVQRELNERKSSLSKLEKQKEEYESKINDIEKLINDLKNKRENLLKENNEGIKSNSHKVIDLNKKKDELRKAIKEEIHKVKYIFIDYTNIIIKKLQCKLENLNSEIISKRRTIFS